MLVMVWHSVCLSFVFIHAVLHGRPALLGLEVDVVISSDEVNVTHAEALFFEALF